MLEYCGRHFIPSVGRKTMNFRNITALFLLLLVKQNAAKAPADCCKEYFGGKSWMRWDCSECPWDTLIKRYSSRTTSIILPYMKLTTLPEDAFVQFANLKTLHLGYNEFSDIHPNAFRGLKKLRQLHLSISKTNLTTNHFLTANHFSHISELEVLYIRDKSGPYPHDAIASLKKLEKLITSAPYYQPFAPEFSSLTKLKTLTLNAGYTTLTRDTFAPFENTTIRHVKLYSMKLMEIHPESLSHFKSLENFAACKLKPNDTSKADILQELMVAIQSIPSNLTRLSVDCMHPIFSTFSFAKVNMSSKAYRHLRFVNFRANALYNMNISALTSLRNLTYLSLSQALILNSTMVLDGLRQTIHKRNIKHLDLNGFNSGILSCRSLRPKSNPYKEIEDFFFNETQIFGADFTLANITSEPNGSSNATSGTASSAAVPTFPNIDKFNITALFKDGGYLYEDKLLSFVFHHMMHSMPSIFIQRTQMIQAILNNPLGVVNSQLRFFDMSMNYFYESSPSNWNFSDFRALVHLNLSHDSLESLPLDLGGMAALTTLDLSYNKLKGEDFEAVFSKMVSLKRLFLEGNMISTISKESFVPLTSLNQLNINSNHLNYGDFLLPNTKALVLNLDGNNIESFTETFMNSIDNFANRGNLSISAIDNLFMCYCNSIAFIKWLKQVSDKVIVNKSTLSCVTGESLTSIDMRKLKRNCHHTNIPSNLPAIIIPIASLLLLIAVCWCYCYRWTIRWYSYRFQQMIPCTAAYRQKREADQKLVEDTDYDVAIIYDFEDKKSVQWITESLVPICETWNLQIFLNQPVTEKSLLENFTHVVGSSRIFLFVLTAKFAESDLCQMMTNLVLPTYLQNMVFIDLEAMPKHPQKISGSVLNRLKTIQPTVTYPDKLEDEPVFWNTLHKLLVPKTSYLCTA